MELLIGGTLESRIGQLFYIWDLRKYWYEIFLGLKYFYFKGLIYRDLKPANVLFNKYNTIKLCDFGLSRQLSTKDSLATLFCGSLLYMAPEVVKRAWSGIIVLGMYNKIPNLDKLRKDGWQDPFVFGFWLNDLREAVENLDQHFRLLQGHLIESPLARRDAGSIAEELKTKYKEDVIVRRVIGTIALFVKRDRIL
ncbi:kinase-like protein [Cadophora sp. DSE1049]|nr:kinase-like protein [Cadophora sp. DSE1049]